MDKPLKVGFDLDGVILYNPIRVYRPVVAVIKKVLLKKKKLKFFYPKTPLQQYLFYLFHKSSIFVAPGFQDIKQLAKEGKIEAYIITGRYHYLKKDLDKWLKKMEIEPAFRGVFHNKENEQPHLFKEQMIKKLDLDIFVEDNWDIVNYLTNQFKNEKKIPKIVWIYNLFDRKIVHPYKYPYLKKVITLFTKNEKA